MYHFSIFAQPFLIPTFNVDCCYSICIRHGCWECGVRSWKMNSILFLFDEKKKTTREQKIESAIELWMYHLNWNMLNGWQKAANWYNCGMQSFYVDFQFYNWIFRSCYIVHQLKWHFFAGFLWPENVPSILFRKSIICLAIHCSHRFENVPFKPK